MVALLTRAVIASTSAVFTTAALAADGDRHTWTFDVAVGYPATSTDLEPWIEGGEGKLRFGDDAGLAGNHFAAEYRGRITDTLRIKTVLDYADDASSGLDLTEAYLEWRPIPKSANQHTFRFGAFYPPVSLENSDVAWSSPFSTSWSTINTWLGEEVRPLGAEWRIRRRLGFAGSPHELGGFVSAFYGNDPAGTLLFWRGFALHDRQTRLNDKLPMPPMPVFGAGGVVVGARDQSVEPIEEIDDEPGYYAGIEWRYARRALVQLAHYDNRADPESFRDGQWGWNTSFTHVGAQVDLPGGFGLMSQWMGGATYWLIGVTPTGMRTPFTELVDDEFDASFLMLTRRLATPHRVSVRYDTFDFAREEMNLTIDSGHAWTVAYEYEATPSLALAFEWLRIESTRDLWPMFYGLPRDASEDQLRLKLNYRLHSPATR
jgi:hypothetical protein